MRSHFPTHKLIENLMPRFETTLIFGKLRQIIALCCLQISLVLGLAIGDGSSAIALPVLSETPSSPVARVTAEPLESETGARRAEKASEKVFQGLETTKRKIGKTERRKEAIEHGREKASGKLESLADKARRAQESGETLTPVEKKILKRLPTEE
jgi:hypothetical protein